MRGAFNRRFFFSLLVFALGLGMGMSILLLVKLPGNPKLPHDSPGLYRKSPDPELEWERIPNWTGLIAGVTVHINSRGYRGPEISDAPAPGVTRIVVIGDSVAMGQGVTDDHCLPAALERELSRRAGRPFEVVNAGVRGYAARQYPAALRKALPLSPRLVVMVLTLVNDPEREKWVPQSERLRELQNSWLARLPFTKPLLIKPFEEEIRRLFIPHVRGLYDPAGREWPMFLNDLARVKKTADDAGLPLLALVFTPVEAPGIFDPEARQMEQALTGLGIRWVNPEAEFRGLPLSRLAASPRDFHPGAEAHEIMARMLAGPVLEALK